MQLTNEIEAAAEDLGKRLGAEAGVQEYVNLKLRTQQDIEVAELEAKYNQLYQKLAGRQQKREVLGGSELDEYFELRREIEDNPLIVARNMQLKEVKALFNQTAQHMTAILGIDYATLAG
jgi:cell fate (sporulation/competence/biofilm development) regulator YlbF (YheA/YmcA/DUF963 family)